MLTLTYVLQVLTGAAGSAAIFLAISAARIRRYDLAAVNAVIFVFNAAMFVLQYLHGWLMFFRAIYYARAKKRGAGAMPWGNALKMGACYRWLVDGQMRGGRPPRYIRKGFREFGTRDGAT